jgi:tRNA acetyltransferase TAN1
MGTLLITAVYGKEREARLEALDCIFPKDPAASCSRLPYGGLLLLKTRLQSNEAAAAIHACSTSLIFRVIPVDSVTESSLPKIGSEVLRLVPRGTRRIAVDCARRGRALQSSHAVEEEVGSLLKAQGNAIDIENPDIIVRIDIIGSLTTISVRPPSGFIVKKDGRADG